MVDEACINTLRIKLTRIKIEKWTFTIMRCTASDPMNAKFVADHRRFEQRISDALRELSEYEAGQTN